MQLSLVSVVAMAVLIITPAIAIATQPTMTFRRLEARKGPGRPGPGSRTQPRIPHLATRVPQWAWGPTPRIVAPVPIPTRRWGQRYIPPPPLQLLYPHNPSRPPSPPSPPRRPPPVQPPYSPPLPPPPRLPGAPPPASPPQRTMPASSPPKNSKEPAVCTVTSYTKPRAGGSALNV